MDRGMVSEENISRLHRSNAAYIVGTPKALLRRFERELTDHRDWHTVQEGVDVKRVAEAVAKKSSSWPAALIARPRNRPCTSGSWSASGMACASWSRR